MEIMNAQSFWQQRHDLANAQAQAVADGKMDEASVLEGQIKQIDITLDHLIKAETELRNAHVPTPKSETIAENILGSRDEFHGLEIGFKNEATVTHLASPNEVDTTVTGKNASLTANFASTFQRVPAAGSVEFLQRVKQTGSPDAWGGVTSGNSAAKAKVIYNWQKAVANKETIAGYVPVSKESLRDYDELQHIIDNDLQIDINDKLDEKMLNGDSSVGIKGIKNTTGIQVVTTAGLKQYYDMILKMRTLVMKNSRRVPTHVVVPTEIAEAIRLAKTTDGQYLNLIQNDVVWGMQLIEDEFADGIVVYDSTAALLRPVLGMTVEVGYVNDQFIKNELCILAEEANAFEVRYPDAFAYAAKTDLDKEE